MASRTIAIIGASSDRGKFSNKAIRAYREMGWTVYPVNPKGGTIEGLQVFASVRDVPQPLDRATIYLPPSVGVDVLADLAAAQPAEFLVNPGAESDEFLAQARRLGLNPIVACSIVEIGRSPSEFA
ncbi:MAG: CoA-binding protein [Planctomycetes bacterium]|nr:CoA-binding protein [Planctomycetota bacterium]